MTVAEEPNDLVHLGCTGLAEITETPSGVVTDVSGASMTSPGEAQITGESGQQYDELLTAPAWHSSLISIGRLTVVGSSCSRPRADR